LNPIDERSTGRDEAHVEAAVHVPLVLGGVMPVDIHENRSVPVDATTEEVRKVLIRNRQPTQRQALVRREAHREEELVEAAVAPLDAPRETTEMCRPSRDRFPSVAINPIA
jgi:hypothetical protein